MNEFKVRTIPFSRPKLQQGNYRWVSRFFTLAAAVIVLLVHGVWLYVAAVRSPVLVRDTGERERVVTSMAALKLDDHTDVQLVRSPVLLSLPTRQGFSGPLLGKARLEKPPVFEREPTEFLVREDAGFALGEFGESFRPLDVLVDSARPVAPRVVTVAARGETKLDTASTGGPWTAVWLDRPGMATERPALDPDPGLWGNEPWQVVLNVYARANGRVAHVLAETKGLKDDAHAALLRSIRAMRLQNPPEEGWGRLLIRYAPAVAGKDS